MNRFFVKLHRWLGFPVGILFVVVFGTGAITAVDELIGRMGYGHYEYRETTIAEDAAALKLITEGKEGIRQVIMPTENTPYYQVVARGERFTYALDDLNRVHREQQVSDGGFFRAMLQLHRNFLLGKDTFLGFEGKYYVAWVTLLGLGLTLLGLWLWWPRRKSFAFKDIVPHGYERKYFYFSHLSSGVILSGLIILLTVTGAGITYRSFTQKILGVEHARGEPLPYVKDEQRALENNWQSWLTAVQTEIPQGELTQIRFPRQPVGGRGGNRDAEPVMEFRVATSDDWLGLANSQVHINPATSTLLGVFMAKDKSIGEKLYGLMVPLHSGRSLHAGYVLVLLVLSVLGTLMVLSALISFVIKRRNFAPYFAKQKSQEAA